MLRVQNFFLHNNPENFYNMRRDLYEIVNEAK